MRCIKTLELRDKLYMRRCLQLAEMASGHVAPNPMVGAVLVHENEIIGEGYHEVYGEAHAEVNCIASVPEGKKTVIADSVLYVSLEPCAHYGKTPPCADLILAHHIRKVVIGAADTFAKVAGKGIERLRQHGVEVISGVLNKECRALNRRFFTFHEKKRPYILLKWAQNAQGFIGLHSSNRLLISNDLSNRRVHKWRHEQAAILIGKNTAILDNPSLTVRHWTGTHPVRILLDRNLEVPADRILFDEAAPLLIFNCLKDDGSVYYRVSRENFLGDVMQKLHELNIQSVMVEGGAAVLNAFIEEDLWDEAQVIKSDKVYSGSFLQVVRAPVLENITLLSKAVIQNDFVYHYKNNQNDYLLSGE